jgi:protein-S-isoprenylcysteine O-methyltransferase Ste14
MTKSGIMENKKDSPGVYIPPPLFYVLIFLIAMVIQKEVFINDSLFHLQMTKIVGAGLFVVALVFLVTSLRRFIKSRNTLILIRPASSLQTTGIYTVSRNPMYVGLAIVYLGVACLIGNWWHIILFPLLLLIVQEYIISREEEYLDRRFGQEYLDYKEKVRRWL